MSIDGTVRGGSSVSKGSKNAANKDYKVIMNARDVAEYLRLSPMTVYALTRERKIPATKIGGQWRYRIDLIDRWIEERMYANLTKKS
mgnify:CR=1 FL=1